MYKTCVTIGHALYKAVLSPLIGQSCRYIPTCSDYMAMALKEHGLLKGGRLGFQRILRCRPGGSFGYDPVPEKCKEPCRKHGESFHAFLEAGQKPVEPVREERQFRASFPEKEEVILSEGIAYNFRLVSGIQSVAGFPSIFNIQVLPSPVVTDANSTNMQEQN